MYLLELLVLKIAAHHHLEDYEELAVGDIPIPIDVVDFEREPQFLELISLARESAKARHKLLEINVSSAILIENSDHPIHVTELVSPKPSYPKP